MTKTSIKVKFLDENDNLCIEYFDSMEKAYARLEAVRKANGGESFPLSMTVKTDYCTKEIY